LQRLADKVLWLHGGTATLIDGGYEEFEELQRPGVSHPAPKKAAPTPAPARADRNDRDRRERAAKDLGACEREVARLDAERVRLERDFADPAVYEDRERVATLERELADVRAAIDVAFERWERLSANAAVAVP
ncbi:MAG: hypothetical protein IAI49_12230, partial [Candidatus Eremiobacteraeota bacterium]|nr:hypothetical protein [Candidatus Eremiobacteraeota bacterium]